MTTKSKPSKVTKLSSTVYTNITAKTYAKHKPRGKESYVRCTQIKGFYIRILPTGTNIDGDFTGFASRVRVGEVTKIFSSGNIDRYDFFVLRGNFNNDYMVGFFISNYGKDINILNIQTWEDNTPNSHYAYTDDTTHLNNGVITTEDGKCRPIR